MRLRMYRGSRASRTSSGDGSNSYSGGDLVVAGRLDAVDDLEREQPDDARASA